MLDWQVQYSSHKSTFKGDAKNVDLCELSTYPDSTKTDLFLIEQHESQLSHEISHKGENVMSWY